MSHKVIDSVMLWEEQVPLLQKGYHRELVARAFSSAPPGSKVFPPRDLVFQSMRITQFDCVKVVILGQDPYFNEHPKVGPEAHGLCFSVRDGVPVPPSLRNILKEVNETVNKGTKQRTRTDLTDWAEQGVLLLNASLTVLAKRPNSHANLGWHELTDNIIETISQKREHVVFMLWGSFAQKKARLIDTRKHLILKTSHPSPLSAHRGFLGSNTFVKCNEYLIQHNIEPIQW